MEKMVGVRFRRAGRIYSFSPGDLDVEVGTHVIVETVRGVEMGTVVTEVEEVYEAMLAQPLKEIMRVATDDDERVVEENYEKERDAYEICLDKIAKHGLDMKLVEAEYTFDRNKLLFYFTADGRVDFRELVKDLASVFRTRIELRQIGVRDETKIMGGIGVCGRELCCKTFLTDFAPVSIKMAKEQNLSLNPSKISGVCGRLMCCLKNEEETYEYLNARMPSVGDRVETPEGIDGEVSYVNVLRQKAKVILEVDGEKEMREYSVDDLTFKQKKKRDRDREKDKGQDGDWDRDANAELDADAELDGGAGMDSDADADRDLDIDRDLDGDLGGGQNQDNDSVRDREKDRYRDKNQDRGGSRDQNRDRYRDHSQNRGGYRDQNKDRYRNGSQDRGGNRDHSRDRNQNRSQGRDKGRDRERQRDRDNEGYAYGYSERSRDRERDKSRERQKRKSYDKPRYRNGN